MRHRNMKLPCHHFQTHAHRQDCGWLVCLSSLQDPPLSQLNHCALEQLGLHVDLTNCVGIIVKELNIVKYAFCVHLEKTELKKNTKDCNVKSIYSCLCITGESCVQMYFVYTMLYITEVHFLVQ